jgi:hypothetical protein
MPDHGISGNIQAGRLLFLDNKFPNKTCPKYKDLGEKIKQDAFFFPGKSHNGPGAGTHQVNHHVPWMNVEGMQDNGTDNGNGTEIFKVEDHCY